MWAGEVVMLEPGQQVLIAFFGIDPVADIGPFAKRGLDKALGLAVGAGRIGSRETVANAELRAALAKLPGAIATAVVGKQVADADAVLGIKSDGVV